MIKDLFMTHSMTRLCCTAIAILILMSGPGLAAEGPSAPQAKNSGTKVSIDFDNVDIRVFIKFISKLTHKNFVVDQRVKGNVTVISPTKISVDEAYQVFESVLDTHGFSTVTSGKVIKIVPLPIAKGDNIDTRTIKGQEGASDRLATRLVRLNYADANELKTLLTPLVSQGSIILAYRDTNTLIITAPLSSINRLMKIITAIDIPNIGKKITVIPLQYADSVKLVQNLTTIFTARVKDQKGKADTDSSVQFVADERTNSVIILASTVETKRVEDLIGILDREVPKGEEKIRVYYLEHADAEELAKVLQDIPTEENSKGQTNQGKKQSALLSGKVHITADKTTNSLVIMADKEDYPVLEEVIAKLDIPRAMVYIECLIMEVNVNSGLDIGTEWQTGATYSDGGSAVVGGFGATGDSGYSNSANLATNGNLPVGFSLGVLGKGFQIGDVLFPNIQAVVKAYQTNEDVNILATPQILTTENEEAVITVGRNVPYQTRSAAESASTTYSSYEYKDVGINLKITPHISKERLVRLEVYQELTKLDSVNQVSTDRPTTLKRQIETTIIVEDGSSVVIGGLIDETQSRSHYKAPCLGDIPILGWAGKRISEGQEKTNLYVFITPRVIRDTWDAQQIYKEKKELANTNARKKGINLYDKLNPEESVNGDTPAGGRTNP